MAKSPHASAEKLYQQLLDLLEELSVLYTDKGVEDDEEDDDGGDEVLEDKEIISALVEEAGERGLDEASTERAFKAVALCARKSAEG